MLQRQKIKCFSVIEVPLFRPSRKEEKREGIKKEGRIEGREGRREGGSKRGGEEGRKDERKYVVISLRLERHLLIKIRLKRSGRMQGKMIMWMRGCMEQPSLLYGTW